MTILAQLDPAIRVVCPIDGVSIGKSADKSTWRIHFCPEATDVQKAAAQVVLDAFVPQPDLDYRLLAKQKIQDYLDGKITARDALAAIKDAL